MAAIFAACVCGGAVLLWLNHRIYLIYTRVVAREERSRRQRLEEKMRPSIGHVGPKCFLLADLVALALLLRGLEALVFHTGEYSASRAAIVTATHFSWAVAIWMCVEGRQLGRFYASLGSARGRAEALPLGSGFEFAQLMGGRPVAIVLIAVVGTPLALQVAGIDVGSFGQGALIGLFVAFFLIPQAVLAALIARRLLPLRRLARHP